MVDNFPCDRSVAHAATIGRIGHASIDEGNWPRPQAHTGVRSTRPERSGDRSRERRGKEARTSSRDDVRLAILLVLEDVGAAGNGYIVVDEANGRLVTTASEARKTGKVFHVLPDLG